MKSIQTKLGLLIAVLIGLSLVSLSYFGYHFSSTALKKSNDAYINREVTADQDSISSYFESKVKIVEGIANLEGLQKTNPATAVPTLAKLYPKYQKDFINVSFANSEGTRWNYKGEEDTVASRNYFQQAMSTGNPTISDVLVSNTTGKLSMVIAAPIIPENGKPVGIAYTTLALDDVLEKVQQMKYGESGFGYMFTENGIVVSHGARPDISGKTFLQETVQNDPELQYAEDAEMSACWNNRGTNGAPFEIENNGKTYVNYVVKLPVPTANPLYFGFSVEKGELQRETSLLLKTFVLISLIALLISIAISFIFITQLITKSIKKLSRAAQSIAEGDLNVTLDIHTKDEIGGVARAMENAVDRLKSYQLYIDEITNTLNEIAEGNLHFELKQEYAGEFAKIREALIHIKTTLSDTMNQIVAVAREVGSKANHLSDGSQVLAQGTTEQASAIEELSASITDISEQVKKNADNTEAANHATNESCSLLDAGNEEMQSMVKAMKEIRDTSAQIGKIIKTIDDIAFQTNILALNAAVEAARAGQAGRGFAVVADQVRNLAGMSAEAVKNSSVLVETSINAVNNGVKIVESTADTLNHVMDSSRESADLVCEIAAASSQQAEMISQINAGVEQISSVVQTNSATAEESAATSTELSGQAEVLNRLVSRFKI